MRKNSATTSCERRCVSELQRAGSSGMAETGRLAKSAIYGIVGQIVALAGPLIMMPPMLNYLGEASFGLWVTCVSTTSILIILDLGTGNALFTTLRPVPFLKMT